jgi:hypothetical protein
VQEITRHLSDIETELSNLGRMLEDVRQQIREVSVMVKPNPPMAMQHPSIAVQPVQVMQRPARETGTSGKRRKSYSYGSTYRPDKWMNTSASAVVANGIQETWSVGDETSNTYIYGGVQDEFDITSFNHSARQSEYSIHARP